MLLLLLSMLVVGIIFASVYYAATLFFYLKYTLHRLHMVKHGVYINSMVNNKKIKRPSRGAHTTQQRSSTYSRGVYKKGRLSRALFFMVTKKPLYSQPENIINNQNNQQTFISISAALLFLFTCDNAKAFHYLQAPSVVVRRFLLRTPF